MVRRSMEATPALSTATLAGIIIGTLQNVSGFQTPVARVALQLQLQRPRHCLQKRRFNHLHRNHDNIITYQSKLKELNLQSTDDEPCLAGSNIVSSCEIDNNLLLSTPAQSATLSKSSSSSSTTTTLQTTQNQSQGTAAIAAATQGTQTKLSAATNIGKCICGAGSFALPHVFLKEGVLGGTLAMGICAVLAMWTMQSLNESRYAPGLQHDNNDNNINIDGTNNNNNNNDDDNDSDAPTSYVTLAKKALGPSASQLVFSLTLAASLGVCSTYIAFIGQTLSSLSSDSMSGNIIHAIAPDIPETTWEVLTATAVLPLSLIRNYGIFAFTSALGVTAVLGGIVVTLAYGVFVDPGGGMEYALSSISHLKLWPDSFADAFGGSFGTIAYLFCVNFLTFPIMNSMKDAKSDFSGSVSIAVGGVWLVNVIFAILCLGFYGEDTQDLVLQNLDNGVYLVALKILLCVDLLFTFPVVFSSGRQILENALLDGGGRDTVEGEGEDSLVGTESGETSLSLSRAAITAGAVGTCFGLSQIGGFGVVANLIGGVAQGTLAFIVPPAIAIALQRRANNGSFVVSEIPQWLIALFGAAVVSSVTYFTFAEAMNQ